MTVDPDQQQAVPPAPGWRKGLRWLLGGGLTALVGLGSFALDAFSVVPVEALVRLEGAVVAVVGVVLVGRDVVHFRGGYFNHRDPTRPEWTAQRRRRLNALMLMESLWGAALTAAGVVVLLSSAHPWRALALTMCCSVATWALASAKLSLAETAGLARGTEILPSCREVEWLHKEFEKAADLPGVRQIRHLLFEWITPEGRLSRLVIVVLSTFVLTSSVNAAAVAPEVVRWAKKGTERKDDGAAGGNADDAPAGEGTSTSAASSETTPQSEEEAGSDAAEDAPPTTTYDGNCDGGVIQPGDGLPDALRSEMYRAWMRGGEPTYGCAGLAEPVLEGIDVYAVRGQCDGAFRALGVVSPDRPAAVLIDEPALLARRMLERGTLRGASPRTPIGMGDFQIVYTADGSWLLIRRQTTDGEGGLARAPDHCREVRPGGQPYVALPPALADAWMQLAAAGQESWPARDPAADSADRLAYRFLSADGTESTVATGWCTTTTRPSCELEAPGFEVGRPPEVPEPLTVEGLERLGPSR